MYRGAAKPSRQAHTLCTDPPRPLHAGPRTPAEEAGGALVEGFDFLSLRTGPRSADAAVSGRQRPRRALSGTLSRPHSLDVAKGEPSQLEPGRRHAGLERVGPRNSEVTDSTHTCRHLSMTTPNTADVPFEDACNLHAPSSPDSLNGDPIQRHRTATRPGANPTVDQAASERQARHARNLQPRLSKMSTCSWTCLLQANLKPPCRFTPTRRRSQLQRSRRRRYLPTARTTRAASDEPSPSEEA